MCGTHAVLDASIKNIPINSNVNGALLVSHRNSMLHFHSARRLGTSDDTKVETGGRILEQALTFDDMPSVG